MWVLQDRMNCMMLLLLVEVEGDAIVVVGRVLARRTFVVTVQWCIVWSGVIETVSVVCIHWGGNAAHVPWATLLK